MAIKSFKPATGPIGSLVHVTGTGLKQAKTVIVGNTKALLISATDTTLTAMVMPGTSGGILKLGNDTDSAKSTVPFLVVASKLPNAQQGNKLTASDKANQPNLGWSAALSADGNTLVSGAPNDSLGAGATWIFVRNGGKWQQQGNKLKGVEAPGTYENVGEAVAVSADGNTLITGSMLDSNGIGAAFVYTRSDSGTWSQQGKKLVGTGNVGPSKQGWGVAISADGNTAVVSGYGDSAITGTNGVGALWVFTRKDSIWSQYGDKIVNINNDRGAAMGWKVAISADGSTILAGGTDDSLAKGAAWVLVKDTTGKWVQQAKLSANDYYGKSSQGFSVALNADGNTAVVGGVFDYGIVGAVWVYQRIGNVWRQQGHKLVGTDTLPINEMEQGHSVSINAAGNIIIEGGFYTNSMEGGTWIFTKTDTGWAQYGRKILGTGSTGADVSQGYSVAISADGNTAAVGGLGDTYGNGAIWLFTDSSLILPATFDHFTAWPSGKGVQTTWVTYNEINLQGYDVERSINGTLFNKMINVPAKDGNEKNIYGWFDASPVVGDNYYRIKAIDKNGQVHYSQIVKVTLSGGQSSIQVSPNPATTNNSYVQLINMPAGKYVISVYNMAGQRISTKLYTHAGGSALVNLNTGRLSVGIYTVLVNGRQQYSTKLEAY